MTTVLYDVARDSVTGGVWFLVFWGVCSAFIGVVALVVLRAGAMTALRGRAVAAGGSIMLVAASAFLVVGFARRSDCVSQFESGKFRVSTGTVHGIQHGGRNPGFTDAFLLDGERIVFGDAIVGSCGIAPPVGSRYAPNEGDRVRIEHDGDRIFRVLL